MMQNPSFGSYAPQLTQLDTPISMSLFKKESQRLPRHCCIPQAARSPQMPTLN
ncbi:hypothetical protein [Laspinema palackyanum]|uniref:hypothetical protein n=1 Tax=Laspinema palackyanum TaxID=3231601 RepID=UPI00345D14D0